MDSTTTKEKLESHVALSLEDESPSIPSFLLCTSQWSALLESTTASLALRGEKSFEPTTREEPKTVEERTHTVATFGDVRRSSRSPEQTGCSTDASGDDSSLTPQGQSSPERGMSKCQSEEQLSQQQHQQRETQNQVVLEIHLPLENHHATVQDHDIHSHTTNIPTNDPNLPRLVPPAPPPGVVSALPNTTPDPCTHTGPAGVPPQFQLLPPREQNLITNTTSTTCTPCISTNSTAPHVNTHHVTYSPDIAQITSQHSNEMEQLSIPLEEDEDNLNNDGSERDDAHTHSSTGSASQRSSMASSTANVTIEWEASPLCRRDLFRTHSRNVSETPSLPPFYSSSTSSAYHSRNSSLGSQMSSCCFESDSMLSQLTDVDSCCHGDLKHPIRLQDSRYNRLGDSSPVSYSSDLSLHHHMNQPIEMHNDSMLGLSPLNLEDTLKNLPMESIAERKKMTSMKSSEWIKRQFERHRESLVQVKVSSKTKHVVHFNVKAGDVIIWEFATKKKDIAFGVWFEATEVATQETPLPDSDESLEKKVSSILPTFRVNSHGHPTVGTHTASQDGVYEIVWDNTYSRFFAKDLYYRISTQPSEPNDNYLQQ